MTTTIPHRPERIVVGVDGSIASHAAVRWAATHARSGDTVTLAHAWQPSPAMIEAGLVDPDDESGAQRFVHRELARIAALPRDDVTLTTKVLHGDPRDRLTAEIADFIVVGAGDHSRLLSAVLGSVSEHLARHARVPVVIIPLADASDSGIARSR